MRNHLFGILCVLFAVTAVGSDIGRVCRGDRVNFENYVGTAVEVFNNGSVKIDVDGYSGYTFKNTISLGKGVRCFEDICANQRINFEHFVGTVIEVFDNGKVKIDVDGYSGYTYKTINEIGKRVNCFDGICTNQRVNFEHFVGIALEVFDNGTVKIDVDGYSGYTYKIARLIGGGYRCLGNLCKGDRVNFGNFVGTAVEVFDNSIVKIDVDGYSGYTYKTARELGYAVDCTSGSGRCSCRQ